MTTIVCYSEGDQLSKLIDLKKKYLEELEAAYHDKYDEEEWRKFVESTESTIRTGGREVELVAIFPEKPTFQEFFNYNQDGIFPFESIKPTLDTLTPFNLQDEQFKNAYSSLIQRIGKLKDANNDDLTDMISAMSEALQYSQSAFLNDDLKTYESTIVAYDKKIRAAGANTQQGAAIVGFNAELNRLRQSVVKLARDSEGLCIDNVEQYVEEAARNLFLQQIDQLIEEQEDNLADDSLLGRARTAIEGDKYREDIDRLKKKRSEIETVIEAAEADQVIFQEQCFVLANLAELVNHKKELPTSLPLPYVVTTESASDIGAPMESVTDADGNTSSEIAASVAPLESVVGGNVPINIQGSAFAFVNKLAVHPYTARLFDLKEHELSSLTPRMRFFKVESGDDGRDIETEIMFDTKITEQSLENYLTSGGRGIGVGVNSFDFSYDGTDPFSAKKAISAKLSIYATSFSDLLTQRIGNNGLKYSYVDLALKTGRNVNKKLTLTEIEKINIDKLNFRLKAVVEWVAEKQELRMLRSSVKDAVYNSAISFYLTPTIHEFDFDETGAVNFTINYLAYIEDYFAQSQFDVFASTTADKQTRDLVYDYYRQAGCDISTDKFTKLRELDESYIAKTNTTALQSIINSLRKTNSIYYISISKEEMKDWLKSPTSNSYIKNITTSPTNSIEDDILSEATKNATSNDKKLDKSAYRLSLVANSDLRQNIALFYLSDLVAVVLKNIEDALIESEDVFTSNYYEDVAKSLSDKSKIDSYIKKRLSKKTNLNSRATLRQFEKMRIVLGPMEITPYGELRNSTASISCTLGDIPISLNYFLDFMSEKVLSKDFIKYPLSKFIKDMINDCIKNFINSNDCFRSSGSQKISLNSTTVLAYNQLSGDADDDLSNLIIRLKNTKASINNCLLLNQVAKQNFPILKISGPIDGRSTSDINKMRNYYIFSAGRRYPTDLYAGNKKQDAEHGIFHYLLGENKGIVKNISLDKTNTPGLKELRFEQEGFDGLEQLREVYNANITTFLNPQTFPGTYIYVEPKGFDPKSSEDLTKFGIGGYYMIVKTSHSIKPGDAETTLNAAWVASKGGKVIKATKTDERDKRNVKEGTERVKKCGINSVFKTDTRGAT